MIKVHDVRKSYGTHVAVDGLSFEVRKGETFGLLGPNGAGKTTTLHMIAGVLRPDSGSIHLDGSADPTLPDVRRRLGIAPQANALYENLSGEENVSFIARMYGLRGAVLSGAVDRALALVGLTDRRKDRAAGYSGGMKRRLNLACALVHDPPVLWRRQIKRKARGGGRVKRSVGGSIGGGVSVGSRVRVCGVVWRLGGGSFRPLFRPRWPGG
jgi:ABC-2 type transport system ATP-binding protein